MCGGVYSTIMEEHWRSYPWQRLKGALYRLITGCYVLTGTRHEARRGQWGQFPPPIRKLNRNCSG